MKGAKTPWVAAVLALALGGPGCFYLGWRRGVKATFVWLLVVSLMLISVGTSSHTNSLQQETLELAILFLILLQSALAWFAYRSCKRSNATAAKLAYSADPRVGQDCSKTLKDIGVFVIVGSGLGLFGSLSLRSSPAMGEMGHFMHDMFAPVLLCMAAWGLPTGIGLLRAWPWARISMLVFSGLIALYGAFGIVAFLFMPNGDVSGWSLFLIKAFSLLFNFLPLAIGVRWLIYFTQDNVRAHFRASRKAPTAFA